VHADRPLDLSAGVIRRATRNSKRPEDQKIKRSKDQKIKRSKDQKIAAFGSSYIEIPYSL
jgi:hypothetical protein